LSKVEPLRIVDAISTNCLVAWSPELFTFDSTKGREKGLFVIRIVALRIALRQVGAWAKRWFSSRQKSAATRQTHQSKTSKSSMELPARDFPKAVRNTGTKIAA
jgi:hypothetical protein